LLAALMVVKLSVKNLLPHSSPDKNPIYELSRSSRKEVHVCVFVFSGTLSEGYRWKDRHGIGKTLCCVANSLGMDSTMSGCNGFSSTFHIRYFECRCLNIIRFKLDASLQSQYVDRVKSLPRPLLPGAIVEPTKDNDTEMEQGNCWKHPKEVKPPSAQAMKDGGRAWKHSILVSTTMFNGIAKADIPEADMPPRKRLLLTTPRPRCEIGESSAATAARQPGPTIETRLLDTERRMMTTLELVNRRVTYQVDVCTRESSEFYTRHHDAQTNRAAVRAEIEVLRRERLAYEQENIQTRQDLPRSEAHCRALEARVTVLETEGRRHEWQR
ncbi:hypothetical protein Tco_1316275, partial [Tanacetum coccineum]